jgi:iron complex outermembrane receptor protein
MPEQGPSYLVFITGLTCDLIRMCKKTKTLSKLLRTLTAAIMILCINTLQAETPGEGEFDVTQLSLEQLLETEYIPARRIARQISDAPSAVSIVTAQDIQDYGYQTLADILKSMRGLYVTSSLAYDYLGGRGFGLPGDYAGRIMLTIDDYPTNDNFYNQIFIGEDALIDVEMIDRVEFIPGPGSTTYGNSAFLGVVNIVTKRGRDFDAIQLAGNFGDDGKRRNRLTYGKRLKNGVEFLLSASAYRDDGISAEFPELEDWEPFTGDPYANAEISPLKRGKNKRLFFKGGYGEWAWEFATVRKTTQDSAFIGFFEPIDDGDIMERVDNNSFATIKYDRELSYNLDISVHIYSGRYLYESEAIGTDPSTEKSSGRWWGADFKFIGRWFDQHRLLFGTEYRKDYRQNYEIEFIDSQGDTYKDTYNTDTRTISFYAQDEYTLNEQLLLVLGLRHDNSSRSEENTSPRVALIYTPQPTSTFKLSYGKAFRDANPWEELLTSSTELEPERMTTTELVWQQQIFSRAHLTASLYRNRVSDAVDKPYTKLDTVGQEIAFEYVQEDGFRLSASSTHQNTEDEAGNWLVNSPRWINKLNLAQPLLRNRLTAGFELQYISRRLDYERSSVKSNTIANLTLTARHIIPNAVLSLNLRNLFDERQEDVIDNPILYTLPSTGRSLWLSLEYDIK